MIKLMQEKVFRRELQKEFNVVLNEKDLFRDYCKIVVYTTKAHAERKDTHQEEQFVVRYSPRNYKWYCADKKSP